MYSQPKIIATQTVPLSTSTRDQIRQADSEVSFRIRATLLEAEQSPTQTHNTHITSLVRFNATWGAQEIEQSTCMLANSTGRCRFPPQCPPLPFSDTMRTSMGCRPIDCRLRGTRLAEDVTRMRSHGHRRPLGSRSYQPSPLPVPSQHRAELTSSAAASSHVPRANIHEK